MPYDDDEEQELSLIDIFSILWRRKWAIFFLTFVFGTIATIYAFTSPFIYRAECRILPQQGGGGIASAFGGLAAFAGLSATATQGQMMIGVIKGDTVVDAIIDKFNLMEEFSLDIRLDARRRTLRNLEADEDSKSGIVSIAYLSKDPKKAADIANEFVAELQKQLWTISFNDAQAKRRFFQAQLDLAQQELSEAEEAMMNYQQSSGVVALEAQTRTILESIARLKSQIAAKNIEISSLSSYTHRDNPRLKLARTQLEAMNKELHNLEEEQRRTSRGRNDGLLSGDAMLSIGQVPEFSLEYQRYYRKLRAANAKYDSLLRQYETARLSEASDISTISIIDRATPPDWKYKPKRAQIMMIGTMAGFALGVFLAFLAAHLAALKESREAQEYYDD
ncbi:MAG: hypothetical protein IJG65_01595 [Synergistaceae bacterium]|nr:hypothetical protein [Synergistaceae bacterium]